MVLPAYVKGPAIIGQGATGYGSGVVNDEGFGPVSTRTAVTGGAATGTGAGAGAEGAAGAKPQAPSAAPATAGTGTATATGNAVGTAFLLAAAPAGRGRAMDAASVLPVLAAVPPGVLTGTGTATLVELADPLDPQTVLTRLRAAAASPGPLVLCLAGQLQLDRRQQLPHLALARSTPATLRYTALPWHWLAAELAARAPGTTTVVADLAADPAVWERLTTTPGFLHLGPGPTLYGRVTPAPRRGELLAPAYLRSWAELWRSGARLPYAALHAESAARAAGATPEAFLLAPAPAPAPVADQDPHPAILAAATAGRHGEAAAVAAAWEREALRRHGPRSAEAVHWTEVRADLARLAGEPARSCELWLSAAEARLALGQRTDDPDVEGAVDRAHHQWERIVDRARARALGPLLITLRQRVPGRRPGALAALKRRMAD